MPQDTGADQPLVWAALVAGGTIIIAWAKRLSPRPIFVAVARYAFDPVVKDHLDPFHTRFDRVEVKVDKLCDAFDELPGAAKAKATAREKREGW